MEKQFIRVVLVTFYFIFLENNAQLTSLGMVGDGSVAYEGNTGSKVSTMMAKEISKTHYVNKGDNTSSYSPVAQNYSDGGVIIHEDSLLENTTNEIHDKVYSGDVEGESTNASMVFMERKMTVTPLTANQQYTTDDRETDAGANIEYKATLKPSKNSESLDDLHSTVATDFEFSGNFQLETSTKVEQSDDVSQDFSFEMSGSESSGEEYYYSVTNLKGFSINLELDFSARSTKQELTFQRLNVEETKVGTSKFVSADELLDLQDFNHTVLESEGISVSNVENNSYIYAVPKDAGNYKRNSILPEQLRNLDRGRTQSTVSRVWSDDASGRVTKELLSMTKRHSKSYVPKRPITLPPNRISSISVVNQKHYNASPVVAVAMPSSRLSSVSAVKLEKYRASMVPSAMTSTFPRQIDSGKILLSHNETMVNAMPDNALQNLYLQNTDRRSERTLDYSNIPEGRAATDFKKRTTSYSSKYSRLVEHMDEQKSRTVFVSINPVEVQTSTMNHTLQNDMKIIFNSTANEPSAKLFNPDQKLLTSIVCSVIFILLLAVISVTFIRRCPHRKNCCRRAGTYVVESQCEDSSIPLGEVIIQGRTDLPTMEHLGVNGEEECNL